ISQSPRELVLKKRWYSFQILGKLSYDPNIPDSHFTELLQNRFAGVDAGKLHEAWASASQVMPLVNSFHNGRSQNDYQWYPEACTSFYGFRTVNSFIKCTPQKGEGIIGIPEYSNAVLKGETINGTTPLAVAAQLQQKAVHAQELIADIKNTKDQELNQTADDIRAMSFLGQYYSKKISGAVYKDLYEKATTPEQKTAYKDSTHKNLQEAARIWKKYADQVSLSYIPQHLTRMHYTVDFKAMQALVDKEANILNQKPREISTVNAKPLTEDIEVLFSNSSPYYFWHLDKLGLPTDWSDFKYVSVEVYSTSRQPFDLFLKAGEDTIIKRNIQPAQNGWSNIVVPFNTFKKIQANKQNVRVSASKMESLPFSMNEITDFGVSMDKPVGYTVLEIASIRLLKEEPPKSVLSSSGQ
ncbi:MAG TPA: hypothetical protein VK616_14910, partial [Flavitalea sp.]|nr:hypothetical protein [Flavitalea sp.]